MPTPPLYTELIPEIPTLLTALGIVTRVIDLGESDVYACEVFLNEPLKFSEDARAPIVKLATGRVLLYPLFLLTTRRKAVLPVSNLETQSLGVHIEAGSESLSLKIDLCFRQSMVEVPGLENEAFPERQERSPALLRSLVEQFAKAASTHGLRPL